MAATTDAGRTETDIARHFLMRAIQNWGQSHKDRDEAERSFVEAAGFRHNTEESKAFILGTVRNLQRGDFNSEVEQLAAAIRAAKSGGAQ